MVFPQIFHDAANLIPVYRAGAAVANGKGVSEVINQSINPLNQYDANLNSLRNVGGDKVPYVSQALQYQHTLVRTLNAAAGLESANSKSVTGIAFVCKEVCKATYKKGPQEDLEVKNKCWKLLDSKPNCRAYRCGDDLIVGIKGTDPKKGQDIAADIDMVLRMNDGTGRFFEAHKFIISIMKKERKWKKIYLTGHSLGGSIVYDSFSKLKECTECHMFNPYFNGAKDCNGRKVFLHHTLGDPVSSSWPTNEGITVKTYEKPSGDPVKCHKYGFE